MYHIADAYLTHNMEHNSRSNLPDGGLTPVIVCLLRLRLLLDSIVSS